MSRKRRISWWQRLALCIGVPLYLAYMRFVFATSRKRFVGLDKLWDRLDDGGNILAAIWHNDFPIAACGFRKHGIAVLVSKSRDGELIARALERSGYETVRGSSSRGGREAMDEMASQLKDRHGLLIAFTVDGPRGPRHEVKPGIVALSRRLGIPIAIGGFAAKRNIVFNSWDRTEVPLPFTRIVIFVPDMLTVPVDCDATEVTDYCKRIERRLEEAGAEARRLLDAGSRSQT